MQGAGLALPALPEPPPPRSAPALPAELCAQSVPCPLVLEHSVLVAGVQGGACLTLNLGQAGFAFCPRRWLQVAAGWGAAACSPRAPA
jgi:hypothetical protein